MTIQPLLPISLAGRPKIAPVAAVRPVRARAAEKDCSRIEPQDSLEISHAAEARLLGPLSEAAQREVQRLKTRDREVRSHEQAHLAAAGPFARGGANYQYATGPDGGRYAVGGEVGIDTAPVPDDPEATMHKAQVIRAAALAPAEPSAQDRRIAAAASRMEAEARLELRQQQQTDEEEEAEAGRFEGFLGTRFDATA